MSGKFIEGPKPQKHLCDPPDARFLEIGRVWQCDCGRKWKVTGTAFSLFNYWKRKY